VVPLPPTPARLPYPTPFRSQQLPRECPSDISDLGVAVPGRPGRLDQAEVTGHQPGLPVALLDQHLTAYRQLDPVEIGIGAADQVDRKSTRLNSSHVKISYAV